MVYPKPSDRRPEMFRANNVANVAFIHCCGLRYFCMDGEACCAIPHYAVIVALACECPVEGACLKRSLGVGSDWQVLAAVSPQLVHSWSTHQ